MTPPDSSQALLDRCNASGITLRAEGESLRFRAPVGALTPAIRAELASRKGELLALLRESAPGVVPRCPNCRRAADLKGRCWHCQDRACERCERQTGSAFIALCLLCDMLEPAGDRT